MRSHSTVSAGRSIYPTYTTPVGASGINPGALASAAPYRTGRGNLYGGRRGFYPYGYAYFDPFFDYGDGFYFNGPDQDYGYGQADPRASTDAVTANLLGEQINQLTAQVQELQNERAEGMAAPMPRPRYNAPPMMPEDQTPSSAPLILVLRDGKQVQMNSYAVMGQEIWDFSKQPVKKIALANIDLPASQKATEANGGEFPVIR
jgi:hypothetical protein